jgi:hypothetical protein
MTKEELFDIADQILTMPYKKDDVLYLANYLMENGRQMMLKNTELQIEVAILKEREACAKIADEYDDGRHANYAESCARSIRSRGQE